MARCGVSSVPERPKSDADARNERARLPQAAWRVVFRAAAARRVSTAIHRRMFSAKKFKCTTRFTDGPPRTRSTRRRNFV